MTLLPADFVSLRPDGVSDKVLVEVEGQACAHIPDHLLQRSSVLQNLHSTTGSAPLPFPVSWLEIWSQYVDGCSTVDWLVRALKVRLLSPMTTRRHLFLPHYLLLSTFAPYRVPPGLFLAHHFPTSP